MIYDWMITSVGQGSALQVYALLYSLCGDVYTCHVSRAEIVSRTGLSERRVKYAVKDLVARGFISVRNGLWKGIVSEYILTERGTPKGGYFVPLSTPKGYTKGGLFCTPLVKESTPHTPLKENSPIINEFIIVEDGAHTREATTSTTSQEREVINWLTDDEYTLEAICLNNHLKMEGGRTPAQILEPYFHEFYMGELAAGTDFYIKGRVDTKRHFAMWLKKQLKNDNNRTNNDSSESSGRFISNLATPLW